MAETSENQRSRDESDDSTLQTREDAQALRDHWQGRTPPALMPILSQAYTAQRERIERWWRGSTRIDDRGEPLSPEQNSEFNAIDAVEALRRERDSVMGPPNPEPEQLPEGGYGILPREETVEAIDQETARTQEALQDMTYRARERAWVIQKTGLVLGEGKERLYTDPMGYEAPKHHPVWADELRYELEKLREMGEAGTVKKREYELDYVKWPRADVLERLKERVKERSTEVPQHEEERERRAIEQTREGREVLDHPGRYEGSHTEDWGPAQRAQYRHTEMARNAREQGREHPRGRTPQREGRGDDRE